MKGYSLHVGMSEVDNKHYSRKYELSGPNNDVKSFRNLVEKTGLYQPDNIISIENENATSGHFFNTLEHLVKATNKDSEEGAYVLITFSGHGGRYHFDGQIESLEFLCFYNRMVLEHEIINALHGFKSHVKIFIILTSCYAGGVFTHYHKEKYGQSRKMMSLSNDEIKSVFEYKTNLDYYKNLSESVEHNHTPFSAEVCFLSACGKNYSTQDSGGNPLGNCEFTTRLLDNWKKHSGNMNYTGLYDSIASLDDYPEGPRITGDNTSFFESYKPFNFNLTLSTMDWEVSINETGNTVNCTVNHPNYRFKEGSIISTTDVNHTLLSGKDMVALGYNQSENDVILILVLDKNYATGAQATTSTTFNIRRSLANPIAKVFAIAFDNKPGTKKAKGDGKRSANKVSDEMGGT